MTETFRFAVGDKVKSFSYRGPAEVVYRRRADDGTEYYALVHVDGHISAQQDYQLAPYTLPAPATVWECVVDCGSCARFRRSGWSEDTSLGRDGLLTTLDKWRADRDATDWVYCEKLEDGWVSPNGTVEVDGE